MNRYAIALLAGVAGVSLASAASAADLIISEPAPIVPIVETAGGNWDGVYVGAFAGFGWGTLGDEDDYFTIPGEDYDGDGWKLGVTAGADFTFSEALVAGIVGDIAWTDISGEDADVGLEYNTDWTGSIRGRLGFDGGAFLPYVTAGIAFANNTVDDGIVDDTNLHVGWTAGAGVEFAVADNVSLDLQYRYSDYGTQTYALDADDSDFSLTSHAVTAGVNFRF